MVNTHFTETFRNSLYEFPVCPSNAENAVIYSLNVTKLWIYELLRIINKTGNENNTQSALGRLPPTATEFFTLSIQHFGDRYLHLFGIRKDFVFRCHQLASDGTPSDICSEVLCACDIGRHVDQYHTAPLSWDPLKKRMHFVPFILVPKTSILWSKKSGDLTELSWARSIVERFRGMSYLAILRAGQSFEEHESEGSVAQARAKDFTQSKRKRTANDEN